MVLWVPEVEEEREGVQFLARHERFVTWVLRLMRRIK